RGRPGRRGAPLGRSPRPAWRAELTQMSFARLPVVGSDELSYASEGVITYVKPDSRNFTFVRSAVKGTHCHCLRRCRGMERLMTAALEHDWNAGLAKRTHALGGGEITAILALAGATDVITFSG